MELRRYQTDCIGAIFQAYDAGVNRLLVSLPTGTGKTVVFAHLPKALGLSKKMLVLAHREELLDQAVDKIIMANPEAKVEIEQAERKASPDSDIIVASVQSIGRNGSRRIEKFNPEDFSLLICDEAHHAIAPTYQNIFNYFGLPDNKDILLVGFTATPKRGDGVGLERVFDDIVYHKDIKKMISDGWLCPITGYRIYSQTDLSDVHTRLGDFVQNELSEAVNNSKRNALVVKSYLEKASSKKALVFAVDVKHAYDMADLFQDASIPCSAITGEMDKDRRHSIIESFRKGKLRVLTNCMVLTEGFDQPDIEAIILARPTQSSLLYTQMIGRGTRPHPGKNKLTVIDIVDNSRRHSLTTLTTLFGLPPNFDLRGYDLIEASNAIEEAYQNRPGIDFDQVTDLDSLKIHLEEIDLFSVTLPEEVTQYSKLTWFKLPDGTYKLSLGKREYAAISQNLLGRYEIIFSVDRNTMPVGINPDDIVKGVGEDPTQLSTAFAQADWVIEQLRPDSIPYLLTQARWRQDEATERQLQLMRQLGISFPANITKGNASVLIGKQLLYK